MTIHLRWDTTADFRQLLRLKQPKSNAAEFCAWIAFVSAVRQQYHLWHGHPACVGLVVPEGHSFAAFKECWEVLATFVESRRRGSQQHASEQVLTFDRETRRRKPGEEGGWTARSRFTLGLARAREDFPVAFLIEADAIIELRPPTRRDVAAAGMVVAGIRFTQDELDLAMRIPVGRLGIAVQSGRPHHLIRAALQRAADETAARSSAPVPRPLTLDDIPGLGEAADWGRQLAVDLEDWKAGRLPWNACDTGILLSGPPGTGKTTFAKALAGTCGVPLVLGSLGRWQAAGHLGQMLKAMRASFDEARKLAPSILLIDELDAVGDRNRMDADDLHYGGQVVAALLECLDGAEGREGVVIVGATNFPDHIDAAIKRPGRLDRHVFIPLPDRQARVDILRHHGADLPLNDLDHVAGRLEGRSGADIEAVVKAARRRARAGRRILQVHDLLAELPPSVAVPSEVRFRAAVHEAGHAVVAHALGFGVVKRLSIATELDRRTGIQLGGGAEIDREPITHRTRDDYLVEIAVLTAGGAAEEMILGNRSEGSGGDERSDLAQATVIAGRIVASAGLDGSLAFLAPADPEALIRAVRLVPDIRSRVETILKQGTELAVAVLGVNRKRAERIAAELAGRAVLEGASLEQALGAASLAVEEPSLEQSIR